jgi:hypothetical protein
MSSKAVAAIGVVVAVVGGVFLLQGVGVLGGSFMSGSGIWAVIGLVLAITGLLLFARGTRRRQGR